MVLEEKSIPENFKKALSDPSNFKKACRIAEKFGVFGDGIGGDVIDMVFEKTMKGELPLEEIAGEIKRKLNTSQELAGEIAKEINLEMFAKYRDGLDKIYVNFTKKEEIKSPDKGPEKAHMTDKKPQDKKDDKIEDILKNLSLEIEKEKDKRKKIDEELKNHIPQKITPEENIENNVSLSPKNNNEASFENGILSKKIFSDDPYKENIDTKEKKLAAIRGEDGKIKKIL